ncbi:inactive protein RESTRICTED TEV MOVEMENT 2-like [Juglans microcarpa x Juglans regia]|uniref:inactive protein RESTRICTED TEV MOVEMENT 2-like n=1 Tax=Juglans microcarpa x Juglans regia TaxID=2249226 RepID=UPI001B7DE854|nr:inactive protein RESTRICTED TEV MOVEMENT 2-like [Juglans microcarpa x Juglans regia]
METKCFDQEDLEPYCKWQYGEKCDILVVHLHGFVEEQVKISPKSNGGILTITGERPLDGYRTRWKKFRKEVKVSNIYQANAIKTKYEKGTVRIMMPKKSSLAAKFDLLGSKINVEIIIWFALGVSIACGRCYV